MLSLIKNLYSPLLSFVALTLAASFMGTFLGIKTKEITNDEWIVGAMISSTYIGGILGAFTLEPLIARIGPIRIVATFSSLLAITSLLHALYFSPIFWMLLRATSGFSLAGLYIVIESWLLSKSTGTNRGKVLSIYTACLFLSQSMGQIFLVLDTKSMTISLIVIAVFYMLSVLPVSLTSLPTPNFSSKKSILNISLLYKIFPVGLIGAFLAGMIMGSIYGHVHNYVTDIGLIDELPFVMTTIILGGAVLQYPVGLLADKFDKRKILITLLSFVVATSLAIVFLKAEISFSYLHYILFFILGGTCFSLYTISTALFCDNIGSYSLLAAIGGLSISYSLGAVFGPLTAPMFTDFLGPSGLFIFFIAIASSLMLFCLYCFFSRSQKPEATDPYFPIIQTVPMVNKFFTSLKEEYKKITKQET